MLFNDKEPLSLLSPAPETLALKACSSLGWWIQHSNLMTLAVVVTVTMKMILMVVERFQHPNKAGPGLIVVVIWMPCGHFKHCFISTVATESSPSTIVMLPFPPTICHRDGHQITTSNLWPLKEKKIRERCNFQIRKLVPIPLCEHRSTLAPPASFISNGTSVPNCLVGFLNFVLCYILFCF